MIGAIVRVTPGPIIGSLTTLIADPYCCDRALVLTARCCDQLPLLAVLHALRGLPYILQQMFGESDGAIVAGGKKFEKIRSYREQTYSSNNTKLIMISSFVRQYSESLSGLGLDGLMELVLVLEKY